MISKSKVIFNREDSLQMPQNNLIKCGCAQCLGLNNKNTLSRSGSDSSLSEVAVLPFSNKGFTGSTYIDGILWGGNYWNTGAPKTIDYSFWNDGTESFDDAYGNTATNAYDWVSYEKTATVNALNSWAAVADIKFVDVGDNNGNATLGFYNIDNAQIDGSLGVFKPPGTNGGGIGYFNREGVGWDTTGLLQGGYGFITLIHELGHGLGLAHPHDNGGGSSIYPGVTGPFGSLGDYGLNQGVYTTMSYNDGLVYSGFDPGTYDYGYQGAPMAFDIAAIQYLYGANTSYKTANDIYSIPTVNASGTFYSCIWDAGGFDKISATGATAGATINLNDATLNATLDGAGAGGYISSAPGIYGGFTIANGVIIENADGSGFNDTITGNEFNNNISAGAGNDSLIAGAGNDTVYGLDGNDTATGDVGNDSLLGATGNDNLQGGAGNDTLQGGVGLDFLNGDVGNDSLLGAGDNDTLYGLDGNDTLSGDAGNDNLQGGVGNDSLNGGDGNDTLNGGAGIDSILGGNGNDNLQGGAGNDSLTGNLGNDSFTYATGAAFATGSVGIDTISDFTNGADKIVLSKTTFTAISSSVGTGFSVASEFATVTTYAQAESSTADIVYNSNSDRVFYNQNGAAAGFGTGGAFAAFTNNPTLVASDFSIIT